MTLETETGGGSAELPRFGVEGFFGDDAFEPLLEQAQVGLPIGRAQDRTQILLGHHQRVFGRRRHFKKSFDESPR